MDNQAQIPDLAELKRLAEAASVESPGAPWAYEPHGDTGEYGVGALVNEQGNYVEGRQGSCEMSVVVPVAPEVSSEVFAAFIAAANPSALLALIAEIQALRKDSARYQWLRDKSESGHSFYLSVPLWLSGIRFRKEDVDAGIDTAMGSGEPS
ncbi:hypothetical protein [Pseudomonas fluorescens]|uniref:hypothetical protein n=1 Tax=Pseudomonas fluorescens TaxID=294 RepID=UPI00125BBE06|nr:hypothetical protein [Pseudomonas fluorescens]VVN80897.1 hypothetical protein PS720_01091 [Pseudomonas fluorescens]